MRAPLVRAVLLLALLPAVARAQTLALKESDALARLSDDSPRVRALRAGVDVARADVLIAGRWANPRLTWDRESVAGNTEHISSVTQPLPVTGRRGLEVQAASALVQATSSRADEAVRRARADVKRAFAELVAAQARQRELQLARTRLQDVVRILERREAAGDSAGFDRLRAERELFDLDADEASAAIERARAQGVLAGFFVGVDAPRIVAVRATTRSLALPPLSSLIERAEATRGELAALQQEKAAAGFSVQAADRRRIPEPEVIAGTKSSSLNGGDLGSVVSVVATMPLFDRGRAERAQAEARQRQATARAEAFRQALHAEVASLRDVVEQRRQVAEKYRRTAVGAGDEIERVARVSYEAGERGILELLDAYRTGLAASARQAALDLAVRQAEIELEFATGLELPE